MKKEILYNGADFCQNCNQCPVVEYDTTHDAVTISDPGKPRNGKFTMTSSEYRALLANAKKI